MQHKTRSQPHPYHPHQEMASLGLYTSRDRVLISSQRPLQCCSDRPTAVLILKNRGKKIDLKLKENTRPGPSPCRQMNDCIQIITYKQGETWALCKGPVRLNGLGREGEREDHGPDGGSDCRLETAGFTLP